MMSAATMPLVPCRPTPTITTEARMSVISVIPLTGLDPTMAMALAATVVKRKAMTATRTIATSACSILPSITPNQKKRNVRSIVTIDEMAINRNGRSRSVRCWATPASPPPFISFAARETAPLMMPHDLMMPMIPAIAIPPMPIDLPYALKICSGNISPTAVVIDGSHWFNTSEPKNSARPGTMSHHTESDPNVMMSEYLKPMI